MIEMMAEIRSGQGMMEAKMKAWLEKMDAETKNSLELHIYCETETE
jgi:hypothetical protein